MNARERTYVTYVYMTPSRMWRAMASDFARHYAALSCLFWTDAPALIFKQRQIRLIGSSLAGFDKNMLR